MEIAFKQFNEINKLPDVVDKHRLWLKDYTDKKYSKALDGIDLIKWKNTKYSDFHFETDINKIGELGNRLRIEFDGDEIKAKQYLEETRNKLKELGFGFIRSTHHGKSDYLWIEFTRDLTTQEKKNFLMWIAPEGSEIDLNFSSPNFCFPVLWAIHWKHSNYRELPVEYFEGEKIDYDKLNIKKPKGKLLIKKTNGFNYKTFKIFSREGQTKVFIKEQPFFYDKSGIWWFWNKKKFLWEIIDEVDILNIVNQILNIDIINSKTRNEILNSLKQEGRKNMPNPIKSTWIQFQDLIYDIQTGESFEATPEYFATNPIPYKLHNDNFELTPVMDRIFEEWVGKEYAQTLYEIIAYCLLPAYPLHRLFCLVGAGLNGKGCFLRLLEKFIGKTNVISTELDTLITSRFEVSKLYKKLVCMMGETNFQELSKTSMLKKLTGGDLIGFEYKNKNPFDDYNYAKIIIATNNLPETTDKTIGFYRRWLIIDFPNQFSEQKDILNEIPEEEYESLALKCTGILKDLLKKRAFHNEGSIDERTKRFEDRSNFLSKFIRENCYTDNPNSFLTANDFKKKFQSWCVEHKVRILSDTSIGKSMKEHGFEQGVKHGEWMGDGKFFDARIWWGIGWKV
jgi:P4 family phage/plasmid primase-like protien